MYPNLHNGLLSRSFSFLKNIPFSEVLDGTSKTLGVINQAIPVYNQVKPIIGNMSTIFRISRSLGDDSFKQEEEKTHTSSVFYA